MEDNINTLKFKKLIKKLDEIKDYFFVNAVCGEASLFNNFNLLKPEEYSNIRKDIRCARFNFVYRLSEILCNCNQDIRKDILYHMIDFYFQCNDSKILNKNQKISDKGEFIYDFLYSCISCGINVINVIDFVFYNDIECLRNENESRQVLSKFIEFFSCTNELNSDNKIMLISEALYRQYVKFNRDNLNIGDLLDYSEYILCCLDLEYVNNSGYADIYVDDIFMTYDISDNVDLYLSKKYKDLSYGTNLAYERCRTIECLNKHDCKFIESIIDSDISHMLKNSYDINSYFNVLNKYSSKNDDIVKEVVLKCKAQLYELANTEIIEYTTKKYKHDCPYIG